jgi:hypothetical protein
MPAVSDDRQKKTTPEFGSAQTPRSVTNFFAAIAVTGFLLILLELASFVAMRVLRTSVFEETPGKREMAAYQGQSWAPALAHEEKISREVYDYKPYTVWRSHPFHGQAVNIDDDGLRRTYHSHCDGTEFTIWMFGGSTMRGNGSPDWGTIPSQLAEMFEKAGQPACVRNFGEGAWVSTQETTQLMLALKSESRKPNLVIFYDGANDTYVPYQSGKSDVHMNFDTIKAQFQGQRALRQGSFGYLLQTNTMQLIFSLTARAAGRAGDRPVPNPDLEGLAGAAVKNYFGNMDTVQGLASKYGFDYAFFWQPVLFTTHKALIGDEEQTRHSKGQANLSTWAPRVYDLVGAQQRPHFYNISNTFDQSDQKLFLDWCHITMSGNQLIARRMFDVLRPGGS